jgi:hypothetical protein
VCLRSGSRRSDASADTRTALLVGIIRNTRIGATLINIMKPPLDTKRPKQNRESRPIPYTIYEFRLCLVCRQQRREKCLDTWENSLDTLIFSHFLLPA